jgi:hypothetical protein
MLMYIGKPCFPPRGPVQLIPTATDAKYRSQFCLLDTGGKVQSTGGWLHTERCSQMDMDTVLVDIAGHRHPVSVSFSPLTDGKMKNVGFCSARGLRLPSS